MSKESGDHVVGADTHVASSITFDFIVRGKTALRVLSQFKTFVLKKIIISFDVNVNICMLSIIHVPVVFFT